MAERVLIGVPIYDGMKYCFRRFIDSAKSLSYKNYDILIVDNSEGNEFFEEIKKEPGIIAIKDDVKEKKKMLRLISSENKIIDYAIKNNYDYILKLDSDVIPPRDVIEELLSNKKDIVSALAFSYFPIGNKMEILPICWAKLTKREYEEQKKTTKFPEYVKSEKDLRRYLTRQEVDSNKVLEVSIPFNGCVLISKKVFEKIRYGLLDVVDKNIITSDDICFFLHAQEAGFPCFCYTKLKCNHMVGGKYKNEGGKFSNPLMKD